MSGDTLREAFPQGRFAAAATEAEISAAEAALGVRLPEQLRRLYRECDGFREDRGNAKYLLSLTEVDDIGSLVSVTEFWWAEWRVPDLRPFVFFGWSGGGDCWGVNTARPAEVIAYHHNMGDVYEVVGSDMLALYLADYRKYEEFEGSV